MRSLTIVLMAAAIACAAHGRIGAEEPKIDTSASIADLSLGKYWYGAKITNEDLIGKVVLFEIWGS